MAVGIGEAFVGRIIHYYPRINVGIVELTDGEINLGDVIHVQGKQTNLVQPVDSLQIDHAHFPQCLAGYRGDGYRRVLQGFLALSSGN